MTETIPDTELHGPRDCMRETMEVLPVVQSVEVKAGTSLIMKLIRRTRRVPMPQAFGATKYHKLTF